MLEKLLSIAWTLFKVYLRFVIALWITNTFFPESLGDIIFILYCAYVLGKFVCGGYRKKPAQKTEQ